MTKNIIMTMLAFFSVTANAALSVPVTLVDRDIAEATMDANGDSIIMSINALIQGTQVSCTVYVSNLDKANSYQETNTDVISNTCPGDRKFVTNSTGAAIAVWVDNYNLVTNPRLRALYYDGTTWEAVKLLNTSDLVSTPNKYDFDVGIDDNGNAMVLWNQPGEMLISTYNPGTGWDVPQTFENTEASYIKLAVDPAGNAVAMWKQTGANVFAANWKPYTFDANLGTGSWGTTQNLPSFYAVKTVDGNSNGDIILIAEDEISHKDYSMLYSADTGWGTPEEMANAGLEFDVKLNDNNNAIAAWSAWDTSTNPSTKLIMSARRINGSWQAPVCFQRMPPANLLVVKAAFTNSNNATVAWNESGNFNIKHYHTNAGWLQKKEISNGDFYGYMNLASNLNGDLIVGWTASSDRNGRYAVGTVGGDGTATATSTIPCSTSGQSGVNVTPTSGLVTSEQGGMANFTVVLEAEPSADVTINLASTNSQEGSVSPATMVFNSLNWSTAQTATVTGIDDSVSDGDISYSITLTASSTDTTYNNINLADVTVINTDDETTTPPKPSQTNTTSGGGGGGGLINPAMLWILLLVSLFRYWSAPISIRGDRLGKNLTSQ